VADEPLRILIVDDSRIFRGVLQAALSGRPDIQVVGSVWSGEKAIEFVRASPPDLVTLDVNMPGCGGLDALSAIQQFNATRPDRPPVGVILVSAAATKRGAAVTVEGYSEARFDFIPSRTVRMNGKRGVSNNNCSTKFIYSRAPPPSAPPNAAFYPTAHRPQIVRPTGRFQAVVIGSSTGGPEALARLLPALTSHTTVPLLIVQHLPAGMTAYFASSLAKKCEYRVIEATDGDVIAPRTAYIAPGGRHLLVRRLQGQVITALNDQPPENFCRPSVDVLFRSAAVAYERTLVAVVLTGMGNDGAGGLGALKRSGAYVIAQDEATSVVWGMPGAAVATNHVDEVLPLDQIASTIAGLLGSG
jgi:two-component system chemotaxis response regulator CheB